MDPFAEPEMSLADRIRQNVRETVGVGDAALTMGKNMAVQPVAAWRAMADLLRGRGVKNAVRNAEGFQERVAGGPKTIEGGRYLEKTGELIKGATQPVTDITDWIGERSPVAGGLAMAGMAAVDPLKIKGLVKGLRGAKQLTIPGVKPRSAPELALQELSDAERGLTAKTDLVYDQYTRPNIGNPRRAGPHTIVHPDVPTDEGHQMLEGARERLQGARTGYEGALARAEAEPQWQLMDELRAGRSPTEALEPSLAREEQLLRLKLDAPTDAPGGLVQQRSGSFNLPEQGRTGVHVDDLPEGKRQAQYTRDSQRAGSRNLVRQLRQAQAHMNNVPEPEIPTWARNATELPTSLNAQPAPAGREWWNQAMGVDPDAAPESVAAFLRAAKDQPELLTYGGMPQNAYSLEDFAQEFGDRAGKPIRVYEEYGSGDEPYKIETEKTHGRGEIMRDRYGEIKDEVKTHDPGDYPIYDERGDVKKTKVGLDDEGDPIKKKRVAEGGEVMRDEYGDPKYRYIKSEGGEYVRDDRGNIKTIKEENPDYQDEVDKVTLSVPGDGEIVVSDWNGDRPSTYAIDAGKSGALLYQTLLAHASKAGMKLDSSGLTEDNALRLLSNTLANAARTGVNPRDVSGTGGGARPRARGFAMGDRIWQALAGETDARVKNYGGDPNAIAFGPEGFSSGGAAITPDDIADRIEEFSPGVARSKVGQKTLMQNAVFKWLENASPEQAEQVVRDWPKRIGKPLFSAAGAGVGTATLADLLRQDQEAQD